MLSWPSSVGALKWSLGLTEGGNIKINQPQDFIASLISTPGMQLKR